MFPARNVGLPTCTQTLQTPPPVHPHSTPFTSPGAVPRSRMDYHAYATVITDELRGWVHAWLAGVHTSWAQYAALALPLPYPTYPLPFAFPFTAHPVHRVFEWVHEYGPVHQLHHRYLVALTFTGRTRGAGSSVAWMVLSGDVALAVFEVAGPVFDDAALPFALGAELVVEALLASLALRRPVHLGSHTIALPPDTGVRGVQFFEFRTPEGEVLDDNCRQIHAVSDPVFLVANKPVVW
ncbi:hypothetical protein DFH09DRAFT_1084407 [Mycena vulgaris]|nr:hypothetical protein DFH09DRAFT_1084407 [Mycena vulgaris]